ncbi:hypothetical protein GGI04_002882 [Coemansia thaxteri]|nr:hypothetical protein GGI04_002882 [Coemansia thaxteri]
MLSSGFSMVMPDRLHQLTRRPIEPSQWTSFMQELNDILRKSPGALAQGVTDFWLVNIATLGLAWTARNMYQSRVEGKATEAVERYNRAEFSAWGIRARFEVVPLCDVATNLSSAVASSRMSRHDRRQMRRGQQGPLGNSGATLQTSTLELVIERT